MFADDVACVTKKAKLTAGKAKLLDSCMLLSFNHQPKTNTQECHFIRQYIPSCKLHAFHAMISGRVGYFRYFAACQADAPPHQQLTPTQALAKHSSFNPTNVACNYMPAKSCVTQSYR